MRGRTLVAACVVLLAACAPGSGGASQTRLITGTIGRADYRIEVPAAWNGTLFLYSHGLVTPNRTNEAQDAGGPEDVMGGWLLSHGFAIAGSAYSTILWAVPDALVDQMSLLDYFEQHVSKPKRVIAWGHSLGGLITAGLIQLHPDRFAGGIALCGILAGGVAYANTWLDAAYAFRTLLAPSSDLQVASVLNPATNVQNAVDTFNAARSTAAGQARLAMAAALAELPGWYDPKSMEPNPNDLNAWTAAIDRWLTDAMIPAAFGLPYDFERRANGNPSWNVGVDYRHQFAISPDHDQVSALYRAAGLEFDSDLRTLNAGQRVAPEAPAVTYLEQNISFDGHLGVPVLTVHTTADGTVIPQNETAYADVVGAAGARDMLRQVYVHRAGHCAFTPAETIAAVQVLLDRLYKGRWNDDALRPATMNSRAGAAGASYQAYPSLFSGPPSFVDFTPGPYPRPFPKGSALP